MHRIQTTTWEAPNMSSHSDSSVRPIAGYLTSGFLLGTLGLLSACTSTGKDDITAFDQLTLSPGDTGTCTSSPCRVFLQIPAGTGSYEVTANEVRVGEFPAGEKADLGSFWQSQAFEIEGLEVPKAYAYIPNQP
jgi:hypothetical protein